MSLASVSLLIHTTCSTYIHGIVFIIDRFYLKKCNYLIDFNKTILFNILWIYVKIFDMMYMTLTSSAFALWRFISFLLFIWGSLLSLESVTLSLPPFSQDNDLVSHTTHVVCVILYMNGRTYSLKSISNDRFLTNFSWQFHLLTEISPEICWEEVAYGIFCSYFRFDVWPGIWIRAVRLISQHTTY